MSELSEEYEFYSSSAGEEEELVGYSDESDVEVDDASLDVASTRKVAKPRWVRPTNPNSQHFCTERKLWL